jgi:hypothetical protein
MVRLGGIRMMHESVARAGALHANQNAAGSAQ